MTTEKWQLYSQTGIDGTEYGIRIRPGYVVVGFQKEDAKEIIGLRDEVERLRSLENCVSLVIDRQGKTNAALLGQLDVISAYLDAELVEWKNGDQIAEIAIKFMDLQKQKLNDANSQIAAKDVRIDLLDSDQKRYHAAWMAAEEDKEEQAARIKELEAEVEAKNKQIKELQDIIDKPPEDADWVADYHLLQSALDGPIIDAARKWHAAYRKAQNSNLMRAKEVERLQSAPKSGLYGKYIIQKADGSPVDPEADYFILRLDADPVARIAALEYAIQTDDQKLGEMLEKRVMDHVFSKDDQCRKRVEGWPIGQIKQLRKQIASKDARIKAREAEITAWVADRDSWIGRYEAVRKEKDARIADQEAYIERLERLSWKPRQRTSFIRIMVNHRGRITQTRILKAIGEELDLDQKPARHWRRSRMGWRIDQELKRENKRKSTMSVEGSDDEIAEEYGFPDK